MSTEAGSSGTTSGTTENSPSASTSAPTDSSQSPSLDTGAGTGPGGGAKTAPSPLPLKAGYSRTTKATHPNLPPGLILDPSGKVCKVCNSWRDWGGLKMRKKGDAGDGAGAGTGSAAAAGEPPSSTQRGTGLAVGAGRAAAAGMGVFAALAEAASASSSSSASRSGFGTGSSSTSSSISPATSYSTQSQNESDNDISLRDQNLPADCPPDTAALGRSTWTFLHTTAAYYPLHPTPEHKRNITNLLSSLSLLYPCGPCAEDFKEDVAVHPPDVSGREGLSRWLCERHNAVNEKLGKEKFDCNWESVGRRWRDGPEDGSCG